MTKIGKLERHQTEGNKDVKMWKAKHKVGGKSKENIERITKKYLKGISNLGKVKKVNVLNCSCDNALKKV